MNEIPEHLVFRQHDIDRLTALVARLDDEEQVRLVMAGGDTVEGVVAARPSLQVFRDVEGEGFNALLRLDPLAGDGPPRYVWNDAVADVIHLGSG